MRQAKLVSPFSPHTSLRLQRSTPIHCSSASPSSSWQYHDRSIFRDVTAAISKQMGASSSLGHRQELRRPVVLLLNYNHFQPSLGQRLCNHSGSAAASYNHYIGLDDFRLSDARRRRNLYKAEWISRAGIQSIRRHPWVTKYSSYGRRSLQPAQSYERRQRPGESSVDRKPRLRPAQDYLLAVLNGEQVQWSRVSRQQQRAGTSTKLGQLILIRLTLGGTSSGMGRKKGFTPSSRASWPNAAEAIVKD